MFPPFVVRTFDFSSGTHVAPHTDRSAQLIYSISGSMVIQTDVARWYVPTRRGVWMPDGLRHSIDCFGDVAMKTAFIRPDCATGMPTRPCEVGVPDALRELLLTLAEADMSSADMPVEHLLEVIKFLCEPLEDSTLTVPLASSRPIRDIVETLLENPCDRTPLDTWAMRLGFSSRTITRHFKRATGMSFQQWKQQISLLHAVSLLAEGRSSAEVAEELGYENVGSFIELFKKRFNVTPQRYFSHRMA